MTTARAIVVLPCRPCGVVTDHVEEGAYVDEVLGAGDFDEPGVVVQRRRHRIARCTRCGQVIFHLKIVGERGGVTFEMRWPTPGKRGHRYLPMVLPVDVRKLYGEASRAAAEGLPTLAALGFRLVVARVAAEHGQATADPRLQVAALGALVGSPVEDRRLLGEVAAAEDPPLELLERALDVLGSLLFAVYKARP